MSKHYLAGVIGQRERLIVGSVVDQIRATQDNIALQLMPMKNVPAAYFINTTISSWGGQTGERSFDAPGKNIPARSHGQRLFAPGAYQESIVFSERDLLLYAKAGTLSDRGITGAGDDQLDEINLSSQKLKGRIENRISNLIWSVFFTGQYSYQGVTTNFLVPPTQPIPFDQRLDKLRDIDSVHGSREPLRRVQRSHAQVQVQRDRDEPEDVCRFDAVSGNKNCIEELQPSLK